MSDLLTDPPEFGQDKTILAIKMAAALQRMAGTVNLEDILSDPPEVGHSETTLMLKATAALQLIADNTGVLGSGGGGLLAANNLSDLTNATTAQANLGLTPLYGLFGHLDGTTNALAMGVSTDGITFTPIGTGIPWLPPQSPAPSAVRDPAAMFYAPTGEWIITYTHATPGVGDDYEATLGLVKTRDGVTFEYLGEIVFTGTGITPAIAWNGSLFIDDRNPADLHYYATVLVMDGSLSRESPGVGWVEFADPGGDWTDVTAFTAFRATNSNFSASRSLNDVAIRREGATFHLYVDGHETAVSGDADNGILHATSTSPFTGYTALACIFSIDEIQAVVPAATGVEGSIVTVDRDGRPRLYLQPTFGAMMFAGADSWTGTFDAPVQINWPGPLYVGNGDVQRLDTMAKQQLFATAPRPALTMRLSATFGDTLTQATRLFGDNNAWYINSEPTGNGLQTGDMAWMIARKVGAAPQTDLFGHFYVDGNAVVNGGTLTLSGTTTVNFYTDKGAAGDYAVHAYSVAGVRTHSHGSYNDGTFHISRDTGLGGNDIILNTNGAVTFGNIISATGAIIGAGGISSVGGITTEATVGWLTSGNYAILSLIGTLTDNRNFVFSMPDAAATYTFPAGTSTLASLTDIFVRVLFNHYTDTSSTSTNGTEDDLYSNTIAAGQLSADGQSLLQTEHVQFVSSATAARRLKKYFAGTLIFDSGALTLTLGGDFILETTVIRESSTVVRCSVSVVTTSASSVPYATYTRITGLTLSNTNILKTTGIASGTGAASGDIIDKFEKTEWKSAA